MRTTVATLAAAATLACLAPSVPMAAQGPSSEIFIYATYFHCSQAMVEHADDAVARFYGPELNDMLKEGVNGRIVGSWGWLVKSVGGEWSRVEYLTGPSLGDVLGAKSNLKVRSDAKPPVMVFRGACDSSEDYLWHILAGNDAHGQRGKAAFSTYYVCDESRETQADALVKRVLAPVYDKLVTDGKLISWGWAEHIIGGKYRRLATMTAPTMEMLIKVREDLVATAEHDPVDQNLTSICGSHQDYIWEVQDQGS